MSEPTREQIRQAPKVLLHDHLDGGLRPQTVLELADEVGHQLPTHDQEELGRWFSESANSGSLVRYLQTFDHTVGVMQTADALERVARECVDRPGRGRRRVCRGPLRARAARRAGADPRPGGRRRAFRLRGGYGGVPAAGSSSGSCSPPCDTKPVARDRRARGRVAGRGRRRVRHRRGRGRLSADPAPRRVRVPPARRTPTSRSTPARRSGCRRSGRRSNGAAPTASATVSASSTTSRSTTTVWPTWAGSRRTSGTSASHSRWLPPPTSRPGRPPRSPSIHRAAHPVAVPGHRQHRQPADE